MLDRHSKRLLAVWVGALLTFVAFAPPTDASPITVKVAGDIFEYATYHYEFATDTYTYLGSGSTGSLSGSFTWDPALMGPDSSSPPSYSYHNDVPGPALWLSSSLTAVTPDYTRTYDPAASGLPLYEQYLVGNASGTPAVLQPLLYYYDFATGSSAQNSFSFYDFSMPFAFTLDYASGQFVPVQVDFAPSGNDSGTLVAFSMVRTGDDYDISYAAANLTSASTVPEPATVALLVAGLLGVVAMRRRDS